MSESEEPFRIEQNGNRWEVWLRGDDERAWIVTSTRQKATVEASILNDAYAAGAASAQPQAVCECKRDEWANGATWEQIATKEGVLLGARLRMPGGWLYSIATFTAVAPVFVPHPCR